MSSSFHTSFFFIVSQSFFFAGFHTTFDLLQLGKFLKPSQHLARLSYIVSRKRNKLGEACCVSLVFWLYQYTLEDQNQDTSAIPSGFVEIYLLKLINDSSSANIENHNN